MSMLVEKAPAIHHHVVDKQVEDLRERMRLLQQDRRANIDLLETTKVSNTSEIRSLKEENKKLRSRLSTLQKSFALDSDRGNNDVDEMKKLVLHKRNEYDTHRSVTNKLGTGLNKLRDEAQIIRMEEKRPGREDGPLARQIRLLENRLDNAMIQYNEAQGICSTYDHIVRRLKEERVSFDNQLTALERTLQSKQRDYEELVLLSGDASHAREMALQNLQKAKWSLEDNKSNRGRDLRDRQQHLRIRKQMIEKQERCDAERRKALGVDSVHSESNNSITAPIPIGGKDPRQQIEEQENTLSIYELAFRKIKDATGVSNVNEVIRKIVGQESTTENLLLLTEQNQSKMEELTALQESLSCDVDKVKYEAAESSEGSKSVDEQQEILHSRTSQHERFKSQHDRLSQVLLSIRAGMDHIRDKLPISLSSELSDPTQLPLSDIIRSSGDVLVDIDSKAKENELALDLDEQDVRVSELNKATQNLHMRRPMTAGITEETSFNQRIRLPSAKDISAFDPESDEETVYGEIDAEEEISRDGVKRQSSNIIATEERRKLRSRKPDEGY